MISKVDYLNIMAGSDKDKKKTLTKFVPKELRHEKKEKSVAGKFIVKTNIGYFLQDTDTACINTTKNKNEAFVFVDFNKAKEKAIKYGGKVIRL